MNWETIKQFDFTWAIPGGAWLKDSAGNVEWYSFAVIDRHKGKDWRNRQLRKQGSFTGTWINVVEN